MIHKAQERYKSNVKDKDDCSHSVQDEAPILSQCFPKTALSLPMVTKLLKKKKCQAPEEKENTRFCDPEKMTHLQHRELPPRRKAQKHISLVRMTEHLAAEEAGVVKGRDDAVQESASTDDAFAAENNASCHFSSNALMLGDDVNFATDLFCDSFSKKYDQKRIQVDESDEAGVNIGVMSGSIPKLSVVTSKLPSLNINLTGLREMVNRPALCRQKQLDKVRTLAPESSSMSSTIETRQWLHTSPVVKTAFSVGNQRSNQAQHQESEARRSHHDPRESPPTTSTKLIDQVVSNPLKKSISQKIRDKILCGSSFNLGEALQTFAAAANHCDDDHVAIYVDDSQSIGSSISTVSDAAF